MVKYTIVSDSTCNLHPQDMNTEIINFHVALSTAKIKLVCGENGAGEIKKFGMALCQKKALQALAEMPAKETEAHGTDVINRVTIAHCNNDEDATFIKKILESRFAKLIVKIFPMRGASTLYAANKGIALAY